MLHNIDHSSYLRVVTGAIISFAVFALLPIVAFAATPFNGGDGNSDGIADAGQANVTSILNAVTGQYTTLEVTAGCTAIVSSAYVAESSLGTDALYSYPVGIADFGVTCENNGDSGAVAIYYTQQHDTSGWTLRNYNATSDVFSENNNFVVFEDFVYTTGPAVGTTVTRVKFIATDGDSSTDDDGLINSAISNASGPATLVIPTNSSESSSDADMDLDEADNFKVDCRADGTVKLKWDDESEGEDGYKIHRRVKGGEWQRIKTTDEEKYTDRGKKHGPLVPGVTYEYRIRGYEGSSERGDWSRKQSCEIVGAKTTSNFIQSNEVIPAGEFKSDEDIEDAEGIVSLKDLGGNSLSLRTGPGTVYRRIAFLTEGAELSLVGKSGEWYYIKDEDGILGWIKKEYTTSVGSVAVENTEEEKQVSVRKRERSEQRKPVTPVVIEAEAPLPMYAWIFAAAIIVILFRLFPGLIQAAAITIASLIFWKIFDGPHRTYWLLLFIFGGLGKAGYDTFKSRKKKNNDTK